MTDQEIVDNLPVEEQETPVETEETPQSNTEDASSAGGDQALVIELQKKLKDTEEIAKKAQYDYIMLKSEFDSFVRRVEGDNKEAKVQQLVDLVKKLTPIIDQLGQSVSHIPAELVDNTWAAGVKLTYDNAIKTLQGLGISLIPTIGHEPDMELHEPLSVQPTDDEALKGKIIQEFQPWYVYEKDGIKKVVSAAKVIVGQ